MKLQHEDNRGADGRRGHESTMEFPSQDSCSAHDLRASFQRTIVAVAPLYVMCE